MFISILFLNHSSKNSVRHVVMKNVNSEQMVINFYKVSEHITVNVFCLQTCLHSIHSKFDVVHELQGPFVHFCPYLVQFPIILVKQLQH